MDVGAFSRRVGFLLFVFKRYQYARTGTVAIHGASLATGAPCLHIKAIHHLFGNVGRKIDCNRYGVVHPFLDTSLHMYFLHPVYFVGCRAGIRRTAHEFIKLLLRIVAALLYAVDFHPFKELGMIDHIFLECVAGVIYIVDTDIGVVRIDLPAAFIDGHENRLDAGCGPRHQTGCTGRRDGKAGDVTSSVAHHIVV